MATCAHCTTNRHCQQTGEGKHAQTLYAQHQCDAARTISSSATTPAYNEEPPNM